MLYAAWRCCVVEWGSIIHNVMLRTSKTQQKHCSRRAKIATPQVQSAMNSRNNCSSIFTTFIFLVTFLAAKISCVLHKLVVQCKHKKELLNGHCCLALDGFDHEHSAVSTARISMARRIIEISSDFSCMFNLISTLRSSKVSRTNGLN